MNAKETIIVRHAGGEYPVFCGFGICRKKSDITKFCGEGSVAMITDDTVAEIWPPGGKDGGDDNEVFVVPSGEESKAMIMAATIVDNFAKSGMRRDSTVIAFGGGVIGDLAGFAAAIYMRGIRLIHVPTTLLAQVDSAIGGKTGVNHESGKNLIGAFHQPSAVFCDSKFLLTLPPRQYRAGLAEVVKYALLGDADFFSWLEENAEHLMEMDRDALHETIVRSVRMKAEIVAADEREQSGRRALLNLGHTFAHGVENAAGYGKWLHGEAVAAGLVAAAKLSVKLGTGFPPADIDRIAALLQRFQLPVSFAGVEWQKVEQGMLMDKKFSDTVSRFVVMTDIGGAHVQNVAGWGEAQAVLKEMQ